MRWYWIISIALLGLFFIAWLLVGHQYEDEKKPFSLNTPIDQANRAAYGLTPRTVEYLQFLQYPKSPMVSAASPIETDRHVDATPILPVPSWVDHRFEKYQNKKYYQKLAHEAAERVFGVPFKSDVRPDWLKFRGCKRPLELDIYNDEIEVAIEYNGYQHYVFPNKWDADTPEGRERFEKRRAYDEAKPGLCDVNGVYLITIPYTAHEHGPKAAEQIEAYIRYFHPDEERKRQEERGTHIYEMSDLEVDNDLADLDDLDESEVVVTSHTV